MHTGAAWAKGLGKGGIANDAERHYSQRAYTDRPRARRADHGHLARQAEADFYADERSAGVVRVNADDGEAEITYRFMPRMLTNATDEPELNEACQQLIVTYVVARERASGEVNTQRGGNIYFQLYETGKQKLRPHMGGRDAYMLKNRW